MFSATKCSVPCITMVIHKQTITVYKPTFLCFSVFASLFNFSPSPCLQTAPRFTIHSLSLSANCSSLYHSLLYSTLHGRRRQRGFADEQDTAVLSPKILGGVFFSFLFLTTVPATNHNNSKLTTI